MVRKSHIYWYCQIFGWAIYIIINSIFLGLNSGSSAREYLIFFMMFLAGIGITHVFRLLVLKLDVLQFRIPAQLVTIVVFSFIKGVLFFLVILSLWIALDMEIEEMGLVDMIEYVLNFSGIFCLWNVIYFGFHYFQNYQRAEIRSLKYLAASKESELNNLKAQLNPHFIFNCMNSIRALIDEHPDNAKAAVTRLSNILRNTLQIDKSREITLRDEMALVKDYLDLEKIRYEERLHYELQVDEEANALMIPPFIVQTQVENAIKHGISKMPGPGKIFIQIRKTDKKLLITVRNSGKINNQTPMLGVGMKNSGQRLALLYGEEGKIGLREEEGFVIVEIQIPLK